MAQEPAVFEDFAAEAVRPLFARAFLLTRDWHLSEDLVQDTLARLFTQWGRVRRADNPQGYAQTVLTRLFITRMRRKSSTERVSAELPERWADGPDADLRLTLAAALANLPPIERLVVVLRYVDDLTVTEVSEQLHRSQSWVRTTAFRALRKLQSHASLSELDLART